MPKIFVDSQNNFSVYIYTNDHEPPHVHVFIGSKKSRNQADIKIALGSETEAPRLVAIDPSISNKNARKALILVAEHQEEFLAQWHKIHDP
ncbi:MAG: DUF4160 domain-containing protein [Spirulina sp. SIO3F2]|nr:DUF4160 domain-containing protein [Spirulina sp. SIO3F2]